jgi:hypothetical protein
MCLFYALFSIDYPLLHRRAGGINMSKTLHGTVRGRTIELDEDLGIGEGQEVEVNVKLVKAAKPWGDGLRRCAGALANEWTEEDDHILERIRQDRKRDSRPELLE